jgi:hypothetical protein
VLSTLALARQLSRSAKHLDNDTFSAVTRRCISHLHELALNRVAGDGLRRCAIAAGEFLQSLGPDVASLMEEQYTRLMGIVILALRWSFAVDSGISHFQILTSPRAK